MLFMFFAILVDDVYCVAILVHDLSPVLTALFSIELGGFNKYFKPFLLLSVNIFGQNILSIFFYTYVSLELLYYDNIGEHFHISSHSHCL